MTHLAAFDAAFARCPLVAILRGVRPAEVEAIGEALVEAGFTIIEVPLNSPDPFDSIARLARQLAGRAVVGGGTVLRTEAVVGVQQAGGGVIISPNTDVRVIAEAARRGMTAIPGFATPSEAFTALEAGAAALKLFPAEASSPSALKAMRAVMPAATRVLPVGGIDVDSMRIWREAGATGFGLGSALYRPGSSPDDVGGRADRFLREWKQLTQVPG